MKSEVVRAIEELRLAFPTSTVKSDDDGQGGAYVVVENIHIGDCFTPPITWMGGHIGAFYPYSDIYPMFIDANVRRADGINFDVPITTGHKFAERSAIQISRRNNMVENTPQSAVAKFTKVIDYLRNIQ